MKEQTAKEAEYQKLIQDLESREEGNLNQIQNTLQKLETSESMVEMLIEASEEQVKIEADLKERLAQQKAEFEKLRNRLEKDLTVMEAQRDGWRNTTLGLKQNFENAQRRAQEGVQEIEALRERMEGQAKGYWELLDEYMELHRRLMDFEDQIQDLKDAREAARDWTLNLYRKLDGTKKEMRRARLEEAVRNRENRKLSEKLAFYQREKPGLFLQAGETYPVPPFKKLFVGRSPFNHFFLMEPTVSRQHFQIFWSQAESYVQRNPGSDWGIRVNGEEVGIGRQPLTFGDIIEFGGERADEFPFLFRWNKQNAQAEITFLRPEQLEKHLSGAIASTREDSSPSIHLQNLSGDPRIPDGSANPSETMESPLENVLVQEISKPGGEASLEIHFERDSRSYFVGRDHKANHANLNDPLVSLRHVELRFDSTVGWCIRDLGSKNGTRLKRPLDNSEIELKVSGDEGEKSLAGPFVPLWERGELTIGSRRYRYRVRSGDQSLSWVRISENE